MVTGTPGARRDRKHPFPWVSPGAQALRPLKFRFGSPRTRRHDVSVLAGRWVWGQSHSESQARIPARHGAGAAGQCLYGDLSPHGPPCPRAPNRAPCPADCSPWGGSGRWGQPLLLEDDIGCPWKVFAQRGERGAGLLGPRHPHRYPGLYSKERAHRGHTRIVAGKAPRPAPQFLCPVPSGVPWKPAISRSKAEGFERVIRADLGLRSVIRGASEAAVTRRVSCSAQRLGLASADPSHVPGTDGPGAGPARQSSRSGGGTWGSHRCVRDGLQSRGPNWPAEPRKAS